MDPLIAVYSAGLAQAPVLLIGLSVMKVRNGPARWMLVALIGVLSLMLAEELIEAVRHSPSIGLGLAIEFAMGPLLYFFMRTLYAAKSAPLRVVAPHAVPLAAALPVLAWLNIGFSTDGVSLSHPEMRPIVTAMVVAKILVFVSYAAAALRLPLPLGASEPRLRILRRLRSLTVLMVGAYLVQAASFIAFLLRIPSVPDSDVISGLVLAASLYGLGYFCFLNRNIFDVRDAYEAAPLAAEDAEAIWRQAWKYLRTTEAFRNPDLDLRTLARALLLPPGRLSQALNAGAGGGFADLVNTCRIEAFQAARDDPANRSKNTLELAFDVGFNSKATFYRALRNFSSTTTAS
jgi:AraC-like DNA-binding protein